VPAIISPDNRFFIIDGHNFARSIIEADFSADLKNVTLEIVGSYNNLKDMSGI